MISRTKTQMRRLTLAICLCLLGCSGASNISTNTELLSAPPQNYHEIVAARIGSTYYQPIAVADAEISNPFTGQSIMGASSQVCVRAPKVSMPEKSVVAVTFRNGEIVDVNYFAAVSCSNAAYKPFPELQARYKPPAPGAKPPPGPIITPWRP